LFATLAVAGNFIGTFSSPYFPPPRPWLLYLEHPTLVSEADRMVDDYEFDEPPDEPHEFETGVQKVVLTNLDLVLDGIAVRLARDFLLWEL